MPASRQGSKTSHGRPQSKSQSLRNSRGHGGLPAIASAPPSTTALLQEANEAATDSERLRAEIFKFQQQSRRRRVELEHEVSEMVRADAERLASERENLEVQLIENVRQLHTLEQAVTEHNNVAREQTKHARAAAAQFRRLREVDINDPDAVNIENEGMKALKDVHRQLDAERQGIDEELQRVYHLKEKTEADIIARRQALAANEALLRACHERSMVLPEFDDPASTTEEAQVTPGMQADALVVA